MLLTHEDYKSLESTKEYGFTTGESAYALKTLGATNEQVASFVKFNGLRIREKEYNAYIESARKGYQTKAKRLDHPIYDAHKRNLQNYIDINAACLSLV